MVLVAVTLGSSCTSVSIGRWPFSTPFSVTLPSPSLTALTPQRGIPVTCVPTGVKHLHHAAQKYDIGVYFEANGHGTVLFSPSCLHLLSSAIPTSPESQTAIRNLLALSRLINQAVGDALSDMLLVETVLAHRGWNAGEWDAAYEDLPNRLVKVEVPDRFLFRTTDAERRLVSPEGLQRAVEGAVGKVEGGRSFVRPSGTEDCVRVYAEARTTAGAESEFNEGWGCFCIRKRRVVQELY